VSFVTRALSRMKRLLSLARRRCSPLRGLHLPNCRVREGIEGRKSLVSLPPLNPVLADQRRCTFLPMALPDRHFSSLEFL